LYQTLGRLAWIVIIAAGNSYSHTAWSQIPQSVTRYVNPLIGTTPLTDPRILGFTVPAGWRPWSGLTYPGSSVPNAMVQLSPVTAWHSGAGYQYEDSTILGFTHTNKGHWNLCNIPILPLPASAKPVNNMYQSRYTHQRETAAPGYYQVYLADYETDVRLTSTLRCGYHQYRFTDQHQRRLLFSLGKANNRIDKWIITQNSNNTIEGYQQSGREKIYFYASVNVPVSRIEKEKDGQTDGSAIVYLADDATAVVELKIALSFVSVINARQNLQHEIGNRNFESVRKAADNDWQTLLSKISLEGGTEKQKQLFYSSFYRVFLWPALRSDCNGEYTDAKGQAVKATFNYYTVPSLWDTYRNQCVLLALFCPKVTADVIASLKDMGDKTGFIPTFFHGDHAASFIAGSYLRGIDGFDVKGAYQLLLRNAFTEGSSRPHLNEYMQKGYISDRQSDSPHVETKGKAGVAKTLEYAYDDYALAQLAKKLGDTKNYQVLTQRSSNYKNVFDPASRFMRGRTESGLWIVPFDPQYPYYEYMYREANAWQVSFFAPHDMEGLIRLYGGAYGFEKKLDSFFTLPWNPAHIARNVETMVGQYCHGNQPDHEAPFAYYFIGKPEKSQRQIDFILDSLYGMGAQGLDLSGMDDAGEMSAWYVCSAAGLYPFIAADPSYLVTVPLFDKVSWHIASGQTLTLTHSGGRRRLKQLRLNKALLPGYFISHTALKKGGKLEIITD